MYDSRQKLPQIGSLLRQPAAVELVRLHGRASVLACCRDVVAEARRIAARDPDATAADPGAFLAEVATRLRAQRWLAGAPVINATGTVLHTNLGRALLPPAAVEDVVATASRPVALEYDLEAGRRGRRAGALEECLADLAGAPRSLIVNNNAAAVLLALRSLADGREVIVSRGELVEIGGGCRLPDIMRAAGAILKEVGTTNRTYLSDYADAISSRTALLLKIHRSNFRLLGYTAEVDVSALCRLGRATGVPTLVDLGSGALADLSAFGLPAEPQVRDEIAAGADVVTFSADKLVGGPQAGLVVGTPAAIDRMSVDPIYRVVRCGRLTLAALAATLKLYHHPSRLGSDLPTLRYLTRTVEEMTDCARHAVAMLTVSLGAGYRVGLVKSESRVGGGALSAAALPSIAVCVEHEGKTGSEIAEIFRKSDPPILGRLEKGRFLLDLRMITDPQDLVPRRLDDR